MFGINVAVLSILISHCCKMGEAEKYIKKIGERIVELRKEKGMKQIDLAAKLDIEDSALRRIEKGRTNPTIKTLYYIAKELGINMRDLIETK